LLILDINKIDINGNAIKKFKFEDLGVKYENFLNAYETRGIASSMSPTISSAFYPQMHTGKTIYQPQFDENDIIDLNENEGNIDNYDRYDNNNLNWNFQNHKEGKKEINYKTIKGNYNQNNKNLNNTNNNNKHKFFSAVIIKLI
jgi:hypothetical protein